LFRRELHKLIRIKIPVVESKESKLRGSFNSGILREDGGRYISWKSRYIRYIIDNEAFNPLHFRYKKATIRYIMGSVGGVDSATVPRPTLSAI
jgi:hypothetical protein